MAKNLTQKIKETLKKLILSALMGTLLFVGYIGGTLHEWNVLPFLH